VQSGGKSFGAMRKILHKDVESRELQKERRRPLIFIAGCWRSEEMKFQSAPVRKKLRYVILLVNYRKKCEIIYGAFKTRSASFGEGGFVRSLGEYTIK
jgi:hypothetical protein